MRPFSDPRQPRERTEPQYRPQGNATLEIPEYEKRAAEMQSVQVYVRKIKVQGSTVFSEDEFEEITAPYTDRYVATEDLEQLRIALTKQYQSKGFINSGAVIPDQEVENATIRIQIIEGELSRIMISKDPWFRDGYLKARIRDSVSKPLNIHDLQKGLQLLQQNEAIRQIRAELKPGVEPGQSVLEMEVFEKKPYEMEARIDNHQSPSVGGEQGQVRLDSGNLSGWGDRLSLTYGRSEGLDPMVDAWYAFPLTADELTATARYRRNDFSVIEAPFEELDVESESESISGSLRLPVMRDLNQELALSLELEYQENETFLLGEPFSFSPGAEDGQSSVTALRFRQDWTRRTTREVISLSSRFSFGLDLFGATVHSDRPDGRFLAWLGQAQWARILGNTDIQALARLDIQLANESLLPLEQIAVGGRYSVRGYRENELVRDNGLSASLEVRIPLVQDAVFADSLFLAPFIDYGRGWNEDLPTPSPKDLYSIGAGFIWDWTPFSKFPELETHFEVYWGYPLKDVDTNDGDLQDDGIHFLLSVDY